MTKLNSCFGWMRLAKLMWVERQLPMRVLCSVGLLLVSSQVLSTDGQDEPLPSLEFLEYLGEWKDDSGQMIDTIVLGETGALEGELENDGEEQ